MTPEQIQIYLKRVQSVMVELPFFNGSERFPEFHTLLAEAFDNLVAAENCLKRKLDESTGLALSPAQPVEAVGQGASYECSVCLDTGYVWDNDEYTNVPCRDCGAWFEIGVPQ